jgi:16S rRNA processing protein RimM
MSSSRSNPTPTDRRLAVAHTLAAKGLRGGLRVEVLTDVPERLAPGASVYLDDVATRIVAAETGGRATVIYLDGVTTREAAEALVGRFLEADVPALPEDAYYWHDLIGLRVESESGAPIGELVEVFRAGGNEVYRIVGSGGERLVPALRAVVLAIDLEAGRMVVTEDDAEEVR